MKKVSFEKKKKIVEELKSCLRKYNTLMIVSIQDIPTIQLQKIKKELKGIALLRVIKKKLIERVIKEFELEKKGILELIDYMKDNCAIIFSEKDAFELARILNKNKIRVKAKKGQIAPQDLVLEAGPTDLPAGPALSEITKLGVKAGVDAGKITIKETKVIVKKGEKVSETVASILATLEIAPFSLTLTPLIAYDLKKLKVYKEIEVDPEKIALEIKKSIAEAKALAMSVGYICKDTIPIFIIKAFNEANAISKNLKNPVE